MPKKGKKTKVTKQKQKQKQSQSVTINIGSRAGKRSVAAAPPRKSQAESAPINLYTPPTIITTPVFQQQQSEPVNQQVGQRVSTATPAPAAAPATPPTERRFVNPREEIRNRLKAEGAAAGASPFPRQEDPSIASLQERIRRMNEEQEYAYESAGVPVVQAVPFKDERRNFNETKYRQLIAAGVLPGGTRDYSALNRGERKELLNLWFASPAAQAAPVAGKSRNVTERRRGLSLYPLEEHGDDE